ncbi:MAG: hypothetical protein K2K06_06215 [Oscillospiraceae bacterium]|nr:hypothetical protein [Oscillospiraceae bacterium]
MKYAKRVEIAKDFINKNKLFTVIAIITMCYLLCSFLFSKVNSDFSSNDVEINEIQETEEKENIMRWQFYWSDLVILASGGGFCTIMIVRERKKERDNLQ